MNKQEKIREEVRALVHREIVAKVATRWKIGYTDEEMDEWLNDYTGALLEYLQVNKYRKAINDFGEHHRGRIKQPMAVHWTIKQLLDLAFSN